MVMVLGLLATSTTTSASQTESGSSDWPWLIRLVNPAAFSIEKSASFTAASISDENLDWSFDCTATSVSVESSLELFSSFLQAVKLATKKSAVARKRVILVFMLVE